MTDRRQSALAIVAVFAVAVALRSGPLWQSPLPFNPDGIIHAVNAQATRTGGHFPLETLAPDDLLFTAFLAIVGTLTDIEPMLVAQPTIAVVGTVPCLLAAAVTRRIAARAGWDRRAGAFAAALAGALLAVQGIYLHRSMPVDEQTLGLLFVPLAVVAVALAIGQRDRRWAVVAGVFLIALPPTHNLDSIVAALALTALVGVAVTTGRRSLARRALGFAALAWLALSVYTIGVDRLTPATIIQSERITGVPGLFLAWILLVVIALPWFLGTRSRFQRGVGITVFGALFGVVFLNALFPVFPRGPETPPLVVVGVLPLLALAVVASWAVPTARSGSEGRALASLVGAVLILLGLSLTAALTPEYLNLAYRAQTFVHFPVMVAAALGVVGGLARLGANRRLTAVLTALALIAAVASIPVAYSGLAALPYKGVTTPAEYQTSQFASERVEGTWAADNHVARLTWANEDDINGSSTGATTVPVYEWLVGGGPPPGCPTVVPESWSGVGAQLFPMSPAVLDSDARQSFAKRGNVVYATAGTPDPLRLVVPTGASAPRCD